MSKTFVLAMAFLLLAVGANAQETRPPEPGGNVMFFQNPAAGPGRMLAGSAGVFTVELPGNGKTVTQAPYTATVSTETTQVLGDGNRIVNKTSASLARDSQGRTRREETMGMVGPWQVNGPKLVFINDPAAQTNYVLDPDKQTATVLKVMGFPPMGGPMTMSADFVERRPVGNQPEETKTEILGAQNMEGVVVEGKRVTRVIPAGQIGNVQPIEITSEVWFSPALQVIVRSKNNDPRFGETVYQLTGIQRVEPDHSLFEIPAGYTTKNLPAPMPPRMGTDGGPVQFGIVGTMGPNAK